MYDLVRNSDLEKSWILLLLNAGLTPFVSEGRMEITLDKKFLLTLCF